MQHQKNLYHVFIDFKKAYYEAWHEALWATMRKYNINASIIRAIENLYDKAQSAVLFNGSTGDWFRTTVGHRQGCLLLPALFNIFPERIMCEALDDHEGSVSIEGRLMINFSFADDVVNAEDEEEAGIKCRRGRRSRHPGRPSRYNHHPVQNGDWSRQNKSDGNDFQREIKIKGQKLEAVEYLETSISKEGSKSEILSRIVQTTAVLFID